MIVKARVEAVYRSESRRILATLIRLLGDFDLAEEALHEAFFVAVERWQHHLVVFQWCRPIWRRWIDLALLSGVLRLPEGMTREAAYAVAWIPQAWPYIHPVQDVEGKTLEILAGLSSRTRKVAEGGYDSEQIDAENAADNERADDLKLSYSSDGRNAAKAPAPAQAERSDTDDENGPGRPGEPR